MPPFPLRTPKIINHQSSMRGRSRGKKKKKKPLKKIKLAWRIKHPSAAASASSSSSPPPPPWIELPREITANILRRLGAIQMLVTAEKVCKTWRDVCMDPAMWREIDMRNHGDLQEMPCDLEAMCRHAVDRSKGQLVDIDIEFFGTDELLKYIAERFLFAWTKWTNQPAILAHLGSTIESLAGKIGGRLASFVPSAICSLFTCSLYLFS